MSDTMDVGKKLVEFCRQGKHVEAVDALYGPNIVSIEPQDFPGMPRRTEGIAAVRGKNEHWIQNNQVHRSEVRGPFPHGDRVIVQFAYDFTTKSGPMAGKRTSMEEAALYTVRDGKVVQEEFFYQMGQ